MEDDVRQLRAIAQAYLDAAYEMDADKFASVFHTVSSVSKVGEDGNVSVTPIHAWLDAVRTIEAPSRRGLERRDEISSIDVENALAVVKVKFQIAARRFTDLLSCLKVDGHWKIVQKVFVMTN
jgi:hypothetical protein